MDQPQQAPDVSSYRRIMQSVRGFMLTQALHVAAKLALFDHIGDGDASPAELAQATGAHEPSLRRLLRFLGSLDVLRETAEGRFRIGELGRALRADHPFSARAMAIMYGEPFIWQAWGSLHEAVLSGRSAFEVAHGEPLFDHLARHPQDAAVWGAR